ncbi:MAG: DUF2442 domain-containing protein [Tunicatimonas sp.]
MNTIWVTEATYTADYKVYLAFSDGSSGEVDLESHFQTPIFQPLREKEYFKSFKLGEWTLEWENGADFAPEFLYDLASKTEPQRV